MDWLAFAGSIIGGIIGGLFTFLGVKLTIKHDDYKKKKEEQKKILEAKPRLEVVDFKEVGKHKNSKSDMDVICLTIKGVNKNDRRLEFIYDEKALDRNNLVSCEFILRNTGITEIDSVCLISNLPMNMSVIELRNAKFLVNKRCLNYKACSDKRFIKSGEQIKLRVYFIEDQVITGLQSAPLGMYIQDINGRYWHQPLFVPTKETDNSSLSSRKEMKSFADVESALKCFEGKDYW